MTWIASLILAVGFLIALPAAAVGASASAPAASSAKSPLERSKDPVVLGGEELDRLLGTNPRRLVAFKYRQRRGVRGRRSGRWRRIPVQVDERAPVDFGSRPGPGEATIGVDGTVYGTAPLGRRALQYTDPGTFVGPDPNPSLDADDEVVVMAKDAGRRAPLRRKKPAGVRAGGATRIRVKDPLDRSKAWIYLFRSRSARSQAAGRDYVDYDFRLLSGDYKRTYKRADGPNPEDSRVVAKSYRAGFSDRWLFDTLLIKAGAAKRVDILDGYMSGVSPHNCSRSEDTYSGTQDDPVSAVGAFVVNKDGPVRAIRSYVGANSGTYTQRTHRFYAGQHVITTDVRVHPISGIFGSHDLSAAGIGMIYRNSENTTGVPVDGVPDALSGVSDRVPTWHLWAGKQGSLFSARRNVSSFGYTPSYGYHMDLSLSIPGIIIPFCWGDAAAYGKAGSGGQPPGGLPSTEPRASDFLTSTVTELISRPGAKARDARRWSKQVDEPLRTKARTWRRPSD